LSQSSDVSKLAEALGTSQETAEYFVQQEVKHTGESEGEATQKLLADAEEKAAAGKIIKT